MLSRRLLLTLVLASVTMLPRIVGAQLSFPTVTVHNASSTRALVHLKGSGQEDASIEPGASYTFEVSGGTYRLLIRYGNREPFHYAEGDAFSVLQTAYEVEHVTITLHTTYGNAREREISEREFSVR